MTADQWIGIGIGGALTLLWIAAAVGIWDEEDLTPGTRKGGVGMMLALTFATVCFTLAWTVAQ